MSYASQRGTGDLISQRIEGKKAWNPKQTAYAAAFGGLLLGNFPI